MAADYRNVLHKRMTAAGDVTTTPTRFWGVHCDPGSLVTIQDDTTVIDIYQSPAGEARSLPVPSAGAGLGVTIETKLVTASQTGNVTVYYGDG